MTTEPNSPLHHDGDLGALSEQQPTVLPGYLVRGGEQKAALIVSIRNAQSHLVSKGVPEAAERLNAVANALQELTREMHMRELHHFEEEQKSAASEAARVAAEAKLDEAETKLAYLEANCLNLSRDELIRKITEVGSARYHAEVWLSARIKRAIAQHDADLAAVAPAPTEQQSIALSVAINVVQKVCRDDLSDYYGDVRGRIIDALTVAAVPSEATTDETTEWEYRTLVNGGDPYPNNMLNRGDITPKEWSRRYAHDIAKRGLTLERRVKGNPHLWLPVAQQGITDEPGLALYESVHWPDKWAELTEGEKAFWNNRASQGITPTETGTEAGA